MQIQNVLPKDAIPSVDDPTFGSEYFGDPDDEAVGYPLTTVEDAGGVVTDSVGGHDVVVFATEDGIHAFENPGFEFEPRGDGFRADGAVWDGTTGQSTDGRQLERIPTRRLFAFAWQDAHGPAAFFS